MMFPGVRASKSSIGCHAANAEEPSKTNRYKDGGNWLSFMGFAYETG